MTSIGVKGSDVYTVRSIENGLLALSVLLIRGATESSIITSFQEALHSPQTTIDDLIVLAFQTRDIRGGKGERDACRLLFTLLLKMDTKM